MNLHSGFAFGFLLSVTMVFVAYKEINASRLAIERNHLLISEGSIYYTYGNDKDGEVRTLLPGKFNQESIRSNCRHLLFTAI